MKKLLFVTLVVMSITAIAQTNTFPTNGNVGIGTTTPGYILDVNGTSNFTGQTWAPYHSNIAGYSWTDAAFTTNSIEIVNNHGTTNNSSPTLAFHRYGSGGPQFRLDSNGTNVLYLESANVGSARNPNTYGGGTNSYFSRFHVDGTFTTSGNVGVGTTTPLAKFHVASDGYSLFGPNSTWGALLRVGGNGNVTNDASVVATNGNLHLDGAIGDYATYLNYYHGSAGVLFGNGAQSIIGTISGTGNLAMNGTGTFGTNTVINGHGSSFLNGGNVGIGTADPQTKLHILVDGILGKNIGDFTPLSRFQGNAFNNSILINDFILRESTGDNWLSASYIRGLSIDDSFHNPQTLRSWIKQNPYLERIDVGSSGSTFMSVGSNVGIGTTNPDEKLTVNGVIHAKEVKVDLSGSLADFVFKPDYKLMSLPQVEQFVKANNHLPQMPSANEVAKNGLRMGEMQNKLLQKVEELTLYSIEQEKGRKVLEEKLAKQEQQYNALLQKVDVLTKQLDKK